MASDTEQDLNKLTGATLKNILREYQLPVSGSKKNLIRRIIKHIDITGNSVKRVLGKQMVANHKITKIIMPPIVPPKFHKYTDIEKQRFLDSVRPALHQSMGEIINVSSEYASIFFRSGNDNSGSYDEFKIFMNILRNNNLVKYLTFSNFAFDDHCGQLLGDYIYSHRIISLTLKYCKNDGWAQRFSDRLSYNNSLELLSIEHSELTTIDVSYICEVLKHNNTLKSLSFKDNNIKNIEPINHLLINGNSITSLNISDNTFDIEALFNGIISTTTVKTLKMSNNQFFAVPGRLERLGDALLKNKSVTSLTIGGKLMYDSGFRYLLNCLSMKNMRSLNFSNTPISDNSILYMADKFAESTSLHTLKLINVFEDNVYNVNNIFEHLLKHNHSIKILDLSHNKFTDNNIKMLCETLVENKTVKFLGLGFLRGLQSTSSVKLIVDMLKLNFLESLNIAHFMGVEEYLTDIGHVLEHNNTLTSLNLFWVTKNENRMDEFLKCLLNNDTLTSLDISLNNIRNQGSLLRQILEKNNSLSILNIMNTQISNDDAHQILEGMMNNSSLRHLTIGWNNINKNLEYSIMERANDNAYRYKYTNIPLLTTLLDNI